MLISMSMEDDHNHYYSSTYQFIYYIPL